MKAKNLISMILLAMMVSFTMVETSCTKEEVYDITVNTKDGDPGSKGDQGYGVSFFKDDIAQTKSWFIDKNNDGKFNGTDSVFSVELKDGTLAEKNSYGCIDFFNTQGTNKIFVGTICNGTNGTNGSNGKNGYSNIFGSRDMYNATGDTIIGVYFDVYWDMDSIGTPGYAVLSSKDLFLKTIPMFNRKGDKGDVGNIIIPEVKYTTDSIIYEFFLNNSLFKRYSFLRINGANGINGINGTNGKDGKDGVNGIAPKCRTREYSFGTYYLWYIDINGNDKYDDGEQKVSPETLISNGKDNTGGKAFICLTFAENFAGQSSTAKYESNGWIFEGSSVTDGGVYFSQAGSLTTPVLRDNADLLSLRFKYGSATTRDMRVIAIIKGGAEKVINSLHMPKIDGFDFSNIDTYKTFTFFANLNNIEFVDVIRIRIEFSEKQEEKSLKCTNNDAHVREFVSDFNDRNVH